MVIAVVVGATIAFISNLNLVHRPLIWLKLTRENSYPSEWYSAFVHNPRYMVLHLHDRRRLYGWPTEWPSDPKYGHFRVTEAEWLSDAVTDQNQRMEGPQVAETKENPDDSHEALELLISITDVEMVEFVSTDKVSIWRRIWQRIQRILRRGR